MNVPVTKGQIIKITPSFTPEMDSICIPHPLVFTSLKKGDKMLVDDGLLEFRVISANEKLIEVESIDEGEILNRKGVNFPGVEMKLPSLIHADLLKLDMATSTKVDFVALSFSRTREDIDILRSEMEKRGMKAMIVAKIESMTALQHLDELIEATDAVMVARGDLGIEVPIEQIAYWQKNIIRKSRLMKKPVITATQMLQSMTENPRPTRAEATDVANAVLDGTDAVMLSAETASGKYPVRAVEAMTRIAHFNEMAYKYSPFVFEPTNETDIIVNAVERMIDQKEVKIKFILVFTHSGLTARSISRIRPKVPVIAVTKDQKVVEELTLSYGVDAIRDDVAEETFKLPNAVIDNLIKSKVLETGDTIIVVHGQNYYIQGSTNAVALITV
jgi:pyruvate kinase